MDDADRTPPDPRTSVERMLDRRLESIERVGRRLGSSTLQYERSLENYFKASGRPRWMERLMEIDRGVVTETRRLEAAYAALRADCGQDAAAFAARWREIVAGWPFDAHNELVRQHNEWYPIERDLPMDPRTGDYVRIHGRSHRRPELDVAWVLERFPAEPTAASDEPTAAERRAGA